MSPFPCLLLTTREAFFLPPSSVGKKDRVTIWRTEGEGSEKSGNSLVVSRSLYLTVKKGLANDLFYHARNRGEGEKRRRIEGPIDDDGL